MARLKNFNDLLKAKKERVEALLATYQPQAKDHNQKELEKAMDYSIFIGGKRLRPILMESVYELLGGEEQVIEPFMVALEWIHNHSLVHDDLPSIDNDILRRGYPTTHAKFGERLALLAGDAMLSEAYGIALIAFDLTNKPPRVVEALKVLSKRTGFEGMLAGQVKDVLSENTDLTTKEIEWIYEYKTAALLQAALEIGCILAGAEEKTTNDFRKIGLDLGIAFQIKDDLLEIEGDLSLLGKSSESDQKNQKGTYTRLIGYEKAKAKLNEYWNQVETILASYVQEDSFFYQILKYLIVREY